MEQETCKCGQKICGKDWIGDWNDLIIFKSLSNLTYGRTSILSSCLTLTIHCPACTSHLGYYILSTPAPLSSLLSKFALIPEQISSLPLSSFLKSLHSSLSSLSTSLTSTQSHFKSLESLILTQIP